jgi:hypothetical protein
MMSREPSEPAEDNQAEFPPDTAYWQSQIDAAHASSSDFRAEAFRKKEAERHRREAEYFRELERKRKKPNREYRGDFSSDNTVPMTDLASLGGPSRLQ